MQRDWPCHGRHCTTDACLKCQRPTVVHQISVVIPYYQRDPGILRRALLSISAQVVNAKISVIIIDDTSPYPPESELSAACLPSTIPVQILKVPNGGPGTARNHGIETAVDNGSEFIAFLDSDDTWLPHHLDKALGGLETGASFYFCDHIRENHASTSLPIIWPAWRSTPTVVAVSEDDQIYSMPAATAFDELLTKYLCQTSTIVYRTQQHASARFDPSLRSAGEDHLMWLQMVRESSEVVFSPAANVICGEGINICFSAYDWSLPEARDRSGYQALLYGKIQQFPLSSDQAAYIRKRRSKLFKAFGYLALRHAARWRFPPAALLASLAKASPLATVSLPFSAAAVALMPSEKRAAWAASNGL